LCVQGGKQFAKWIFTEDTEIRSFKNLKVSSKKTQKRRKEKNANNIGKNTGRINERVSETQDKVFSKGRRGRKSALPR
jgi:hypothetical protein